MALVYKVYKEFTILNYFCFGSFFLYEIEKCAKLGVLS